MPNNPNLDLVNVYVYTKFCPLNLMILSGNEILTIIKGRNSVTNFLKMMHNNPNPDLVNVKEYSNFG